MRGITILLIFIKLPLVGIDKIILPSIIDEGFELTSQEDITHKLHSCFKMLVKFSGFLIITINYNLLYGCAPADHGALEEGFTLNKTRHVVLSAWTQGLMA